MTRGERMEKLSITVPAELAAEIRSLAGRGGVSAFLSEAARHYIRRRRLFQALDAGFGAWARPGTAEAARSISYLQRLREVGRERADRLRRLVRGDDA